MKTINDIRLEVIGFGSIPASADEQREMARELISLRAQLAELEKQEPVAWRNMLHGPNAYVVTLSKTVANSWTGKGWPTMPLYSHPVPSAASQSRILPDEMLEMSDEDAEVDAYNKGKTDGWNAFRSTMLKDGDA